ncbi:hypothetical protein NPIL_91491 [Nephila pilipes]|uniref:Uncharacterized protein n=1 Tax=Nephila pilipes TaxID=299642 RepID=A0A8X6NXT2_NEPPI|nr:hypothetical protein NPIL_91491 [Nephila pilipes]
MDRACIINRRKLWLVKEKQDDLRRDLGCCQLVWSGCRWRERRKGIQGYCCYECEQGHTVLLSTALLQLKSFQDTNAQCGKKQILAQPYDGQYLKKLLGCAT